MGLSSKQVSGDGLDHWSQTLLEAQTLELPKSPQIRRQQQQQSEPLKCPRCDSTNTKFCYYNNYNQSQPRHFCRTCKRHWTKGGTLRNVPVGGGLKNNKRLKKSTASASASTNSSSSAATTTTKNSDVNNRLKTHMAFQAQQQMQNLPLSNIDGQKRIISDIFHQALLRPPCFPPQNNLISCSNLESNNFSGNMYLGSTLRPPLDQNQHFPFSSSSSFNTNPCSISTSFQSSNVIHNYTEELKTIEEPTITNIMGKTSSTAIQPWQIPTTSIGMDMSSYWNWDDINTFASTDLNLPWDDFEIKP